MTEDLEESTQHAVCKPVSFQEHATHAKIAITSQVQQENNAKKCTVSGDSATVGSLLFC